MCKVSQPDRETPADPSEQDKQEALEKLGLTPHFSQRPFSFISHLCFPDVLPHDGRCGRISSCPDFLLPIPPELLLRDGRRSRVNCATKGLPFVIWLYNILNTEDCMSHKHHSRPHGVILNGEEAGPKGPRALCRASSAGGAKGSAVMKGLHLHVFGPSARGATGWPFTHPHCQSASKRHKSPETLLTPSPVGEESSTCRCCHRKHGGQLAKTKDRSTGHCIYQGDVPSPNPPPEP